MILKRIAVWPLARILAAVYAVFGLLFGALFALLSIIGAGIAAANDEPAGLLSALLGVGAIVFLPVLYGLMGLVGGAMTAVLYNVFSRTVGGVEIDLAPASPSR